MLDEWVRVFSVQRSAFGVWRLAFCIAHCPLQKHEVTKHCPDLQIGG
jgi:hypothetical protein